MMKKQKSQHDDMSNNNNNNNVNSEKSVMMMMMMRGSSSNNKRSEQSSGQMLAQSAAPSNLAQDQRTKQKEAITTLDNNTNQARASTQSRLVFGLSSKTNRLKHDEYAEERRRQANAITSTIVQTKTLSSDGGGQPAAVVGSIVQQKSTNSSNLLQDKNNQQVVLMPKTSQPSIDNNNNKVSPISTTVINNSPSTIRASKYGNFYKPQDLVTNNNNNRIQEQQQQETSKMPSASDLNQTSQLKKHKQPKQEAQQVRRTRSPQRTSKQDQAFNNATISSQSNDQSSDERKGDFNCKTTTAKKAAPREPSPVKASKEQQTTDNKPKAEIKMQFNIPPPPPINSNSTKNSVVSYAKARIYDKPIKQVLSNPPAPQSLLLSSQANGSGLSLSFGGSQSASSLLNSSKIPESILCGFKPPKQINVSKAREKWEGGEPFAKCKSRQRLAAQANKKLLGGTWSMTSVVATQQLQLQQALAQSSSYNNNRISSLNNATSSLLIQSDPTVKILTRGSVLERVQQFEKAPITPSSSSGSVKSSSSSINGDDSSSSTSTSSGDDEDDSVEQNNINLSQQTQHSSKEIDNNKSSTSSTTNKNFISNSSSKSSSDQQLSSQNTNTNKLSSIVSTSNHQQPSLQARRLSFRRRSSSSNSIIPKFYHPNGKPNTYEIELQKKNIVSCFDKFPDRKALLSGPNYRRHFHSIALACGFSEYFKEPLYLYIKHKMINSNLLHSPSSANGNANGFALATATNLINGGSSSFSNGSSSSSVIGRKTSTIGIGLNEMKRNSIVNNNNDQTVNRKINLLSRAASIDNSTMEKIQNQNFITCDQFLICWKQIISSCFDQTAQFINLLTFGQRNYLLPDDFVPLIQSIIDDHPGLKFLRAAPDFHMRYIQTVIARIYYNINKSWTGKININELRRSNLLNVLKLLSQEEDINQITDYFSYEHFYVIYCKFWNLDQDHDLLISKEDLARHNDAAISSRIIDRIFMGIVSKQIQQTGKMSYTDFVWFLIAEEDKKHPRSIEYWFRLIDIDGDGYISMYEMEYFYYEQMKRLELMNIEALPFLDSACQILDLVNPKEKNKISLSDLKRTKMATIFFDTFINLEKYLEHESREFVSTRDVIQDGVVISDWDRYASEEYENLVTEETSV